jgi:hypothetical protein
MVDPAIQPGTQSESSGGVQPGRGSESAMDNCLPVDPLKTLSERAGETGFSRQAMTK